MKKLILLLIIATAFASGIKAQSDTVNYIVIYTQSSGLRSTQKIAGFKTQSSLSSFLNENIDDATTVMIYDVRTKKPMTATVSTVDVEVVVKEKKRKWNVK